jgi:4-diphosphocytidyl-2-C-methyl-D-erythritol kinase
VVVPSDEGLPTPDVYRRFDELTPDAPAEPEGAQALLLALGTGDPAILAGALHNDLEAAALDLRPDLADLLELGEQSGALRGLVSGSGPTCLFLAEGADAAREVAARLSESYGVVLVTNGPVAGAHVVTYV